jgi:hypothetical protein
MINDGYHNIIAFYNMSTNELIGYFMNDFDLTDNIYCSKKFKQETNIDIIAKTLLDKTYKKDWDPDYQGMSKHTYGHLYEDWFDGIPKGSITYKILPYEDTLRIMKINKIKNKNNDNDTLVS